MKTLSLLSLAAGAALLPTMAVAQGPGARGGAGVSWGGGMRAGGGAHMGGGMRGGGVHVGGGAHMRTPHTGPVPGGGRWGHSGAGHAGGGQWGGGGQWRGHGGWGGGVRMPHFRPGRGFPHRLRRGGFIHPFWFGPQFYIQNWQGYGFADPGEDQRWVRYYDDAYLVDRGGRVVDSREGLDWDQYGERWETADGIPSYYGRNEYQPGAEDYAYVEEQGGERHADVRDENEDGERGHHDRDSHRHGGGERVVHGGANGGGYAYGGPMPMGPGGPGMAYGGGHTSTQVYGGGYGYGLYAYPIVIETTTTTGGGAVTYSEEVIEEVIQTRQRARRRARCNCTRQRPPAGERG